MADRKRNSRKNLKIAVRDLRSAAADFARHQEPGDGALESLKLQEDRIRGARDALNELLKGVNSVSGTDARMASMENADRDVVLRKG